MHYRMVREEREDWEKKGFGNWVKEEYQGWQERHFNQFARANYCYPKLGDLCCAKPYLAPARLSWQVYHSMPHTFGCQDD